MRVTETISAKMYTNDELYNYSSSDIHVKVFNKLYITSITIDRDILNIV